jgi:hypothetical protein
MQKLALMTPRAQAQGFEKGLSGDVLAMFHEAQRNILELNKSRLMALDELRQARERIEELGMRLYQRFVSLLLLVAQVGLWCAS